MNILWWFPSMMRHSVNHHFSGFCQDRFAAEGDWDLFAYSLSWAFSATFISSNAGPRLRQDNIVFSDLFGQHMR